ncbi:MAG TPA: SpoIIE family protein phosphatase [Candidatus Syntrophosphaera sp.]|jgi:sigma-B regulation protein RsbU (phosphoserine phosphatase)|nr:MAG: Phosphoserine phosphatase RsbU [Candidatus Cloacimonetes bacterium ADurb.Bin211]HOD59230.1 SpoIIE family protein phosphatase [Candidatus Syntrophosphaera sp.]HQM79376.1 SpoIIE family protein phosphatase [Candidatus Syntrophosphaera sp.]
MKKEIKPRTIAFQIISFMFIVLVVLFIISLFTTGRLIQSLMESNARESFGNITKINVQTIDQTLSKIVTLSRNLELLIKDKNHYEADLNLHIRQLLIDNPEVVSICIAYGSKPYSSNNTYLIRGENFLINPSYSDDFSFKDWFLLPQLTEKPYWSDPWFDSDGTGTIVCSYSIPLFLNGKIDGILRLDTSMENLRQIVSSVRVKKTGYAFLVSNNGTIVAHPQDSLAMNYTIFDLAEQFKSPKLRSMGKSIVNRESNFVHLNKIGIPANIWMFYQPVPTNSWSLATVAPDAEVFADLHNLMYIYIGWVLLAFLIIAFAIWYRTRTINQPLEKLVDSIQKSQSGVPSSATLPISDTYEIQVLNTSFNRLKNSLKKYAESLQAVTAEKDKIVDEVTFASEIQLNLIPNNKKTYTIPPGISAFGILEPAGLVGGDLYDYFSVDEEHFLFAIADVVGKGVAAALTMTMVSTLLRTSAPQLKQPEKILTYMNKFLIENNPDYRFVTMLLGIIDLKSGTCTFSNAGHTPLFLLSEDGNITKYARTHSTALGILENLNASSETIQLKSGDEIVLCTDGITEAISTEDKLFGTDRLEDVLKNLKNPDPESTAQAILNAVKSFSGPNKQTDDITILVVKYMNLN